MARVLLLISCFICVVCLEVTPVEKVITLLTDLKTEVETAGQTEAGTYDTFACFCKTTTATKSTAITTLNTDIDGKAATLETDVTSRDEKETEKKDRQAKQEELGKELDEVTARCLKEDLEFEAELADLTKALNSLDKAITALESAKLVQVSAKAAKVSFLQSDLVQQVTECMQLADALGLSTGKDFSAVHAFLQIDPSDPTYKFRSDGIITELKSMQTTFTTQKGDTTTERSTAKTACDGVKGGLTTEMGTNSGAIDQLKIDLGTLETDIANARDFLINKQEELTDEQRYMKDLTERCELSARDWDQRSQARADEITALTEALEILETGKGGAKSIKDLDAVNNRSFVQVREVERLPAASSRKTAAIPVVLQSASSASAVGLPSFLQTRGGLARRGLRGVSSAEVQRDRVVNLLQHEGIRLHSQMLASLSAELVSNPFGKVKQLIQELIQRLLDEATQEATKKGFCDTEIGKAETEREHRFEEITSLSAQINELEATRKELDQDITDLNATIPGLYTTLQTATDLRGNESEQNFEDIKTAKEGVEAVREAITILQVYYKNAGKAKVSLLASPVDEDTDGAGFSGAYRGKQDQARNIIGILEVIESDFDRTARHTERDEDAAQAAFVKLERASKVDISEKEKTLELDALELAAVQTKMTKKMGDLTAAQKLLDDALKAMEDLKPMCIDTGMTFAERKQKRDDEIAALKKALCFIDPDGVEPECAGR